MVVDLIFKEKSQSIIREGMILNINCLHLYKKKRLLADLEATLPRCDSGSFDISCFASSNERI